MRDTAVVMYTHTDYSDAWPLFFGQFKKHFPFLGMPQYIFVNGEWDGDYTSIPLEWTIVTYNDDDNYAARFAHCLESVKEEFVIWHHEDMPLYREPKMEELAKLPDFVDEHNLPFVKFLKAIEQTQQLTKTYEKILPQSQWYFSIQPGFWRTSVLLDVYQNGGGETVWEFETNAQRHCLAEDIFGAIWYEGESMRGLHHFDSNLYPYIATAIVKGKWNLKEYPELQPLLLEYGIDYNERGEFDV